MASSLSALRDRLDSFLAERGTLEYRFRAGLSSELPWRRLHNAAPQLSRVETFQEVREAVERKSTDDRERALLALLLEFLAGQVEDSLALDGVEEQAQFEASASVPLESGSLALRDARRQLSRTEVRERRGLLERSIVRTLAENTSPWERRLEAAVTTARKLGFPNYPALRERVSGVALGNLAEAARGVLETTQDAYRDLLGYALKKIDPQLKAGNAHRHDLQHALTLPWMRGHFTSGDLLPAVQRWLTDVGFTPNAEGRIQIDLEERSGKGEHAFAAVLKVPDDVRLVLRASGELDAYSAVLHEYGRAQHFVHLSRAAPLEERWLGDGAVPDATALLFEQLLVDEAWHRRYLRAPSATAKEAARMAAFASLARLRYAAAQLPYELTLYERGASAAASEEFAERQSAALGVDVPKGYFLADFAPRFQSARTLRAWSLHAVLHGVLQHRFNEDYWRNPAAGSWLKNLASRGQRDNADVLAKELAGRELKLQDAATSLVRVMGA